MSTNVTKENLQEFAAKLHAKHKTIFATKTDVGTPLVANTAAGMTDTTKIYVYTGSETGYTAGNWYYYNGSAWASGGVYNAEAIETDTTLTVSGMAADAKAVGDEFAKDLWGVPLAVREAIFTLLNNAAYATTGLTDEIAVVENWAEEVYSLTLSASTLSLSEDTPQSIIATVVPATSSITWSSSDNSVATVVGGVVTGVSNGSCTITATAGDKIATCDVTVSGFAELVSISAAYTQSGTVYDTDSLDSLKSDLVVTALYSDATTATVTAYTLSGTLTVGTSTITVSYSGKTTTFNVTITTEPSALYPMPNGEHAFTGSEYTNRSITVTNHNHVIFSNPSATSSTTTASYCIFDDVSDNGESANTANINAPSIPLFTLPANASVEFVVDNITVSKAGSIAQYTKFAMALRSGSSSIVTTGDLTTETSKTVTQTISESKNITCLFIFAGAQFKTIEFDVHLTVNGEVWI